MSRGISTHELICKRMASGAGISIVCEWDGTDGVQRSSGFFVNEVCEMGRLDHETDERNMGGMGFEAVGKADWLSPAVECLVLKVITVQDARQVAAMALAAVSEAVNHAGAET